MTKRAIVTAGGTGGHLIPAQILVKELKELMPDLDVLFVTSAARNKRTLFEEALPKRFIDAATLRMQPFSWPRSFWKITKGTLQSIAILNRFPADLVIGFGSFHTLPLLTASWLLSVPMVLHEANSMPGRVNRLFSSQAAWTGLFFPDTAKKLKGATKQACLPLRPEFSQDIHVQKKEALAAYGLEEGRKTLLVFGGSQGAKMINSLMLKTVPLLAKKEPISVIHFTGCMDEMFRVEKLYRRYNIPHVVKDFERQMHLAWACADCVVSRSGAATIAEQLACQVPAIFIPYPHARDDHQRHNALYVEKVLGGAKCIEEKVADPNQIALHLKRLLDPDINQVMRQNLRKGYEQLERRQFCQEIVQHLQNTAS